MWLAVACTDSTSSVPSSSAGGETARDAAAPDAGAIVPDSCLECSEAHQGDCHELAQKCVGDPSCNKILDCTFPVESAGCGLDKAGAACTRDCIATRCIDAESTELYLALEQCLYCEKTCADSCAPYCKALAPQKPIGDCAPAVGGGAGFGAGGDGTSGSGTTVGGASGSGMAGDLAGSVGTVAAGTSGNAGLGGASGSGPRTSSGGTAGANAGTAGLPVSFPIAGAFGDTGQGGGG